jgi:hypothetical protein
MTVNPHVELLRRVDEGRMLGTVGVSDPAVAHEVEERSVREEEVLAALTGAAEAEADRAWNRLHPERLREAPLVEPKLCGELGSG